MHHVTTIIFLFPDEAHAQRVVNHLAGVNIPQRRMHAIAHKFKLKTLPQATKRQKNNIAFRIENFFWSANLMIFGLALMALLFALLVGEISLVISSLLIMLASFIVGEQYVVNVPTVHLTEFKEALAHGDVLLMIDVPFNRIVEIENLVHHKYPEAVIGGVSWSVDAFGI